MLENRLHKRHPLIQFLLDNGIYIILAIVIWRLPFWLSDYFDNPVMDLTSRRALIGNQAMNWMAVAINLYTFAILAMSYNLVFGMSGLLSFGHAVFFGVPIYIVIWLMTSQAYGLTTSIGVALAVSALLGLFVALAAFRVHGVYFAMFTLAFAEIFFQLAQTSVFYHLTNGSDGIQWSTDTRPEIGQPINRYQLYQFAALAMGFTFLFIRRLMNSPTGRVLLAMRENEQRALTMGYNTYRYKALVLTIAAVLGALSGVLFILNRDGANPTNLGLTWTVEPLLMTIIGGIGTVIGPVLGAAVLYLGETFFSKPDLYVDLDFIIFRYTDTVNTESEWSLALGLVFIVIVMLVPYGIVGQLNLIYIRLRQWLRRFVYDPLVRRYPQLAGWMEPVTGEPAVYAMAVAEASRNSSLMDWAVENPLSALYGSIITLALLGGIVRQDVQAGISLLLFMLLVTIVPVLLLLLYRNQARLVNLLRLPRRSAR